MIKHLGRRRAGRAKVLINGINERWVTVYVCLLEKSEIRNVSTSRSSVFQAIKDLGISAGFLILELTTWKTQDDKLGEFGDKLIELYVVDYSPTSERGYVGDKNDFSAILRERNRAGSVQDGGG